jgi:hypothetical protein
MALQSVREFVERMRADEDWGTLYARLRVKADAAETTGARGFVPTEYYEDFTVPEGLGTVLVLVEVPSSAPSSGTGANVLREDAVLPEFGLPFDLNGDGTLDALDHGADYMALPFTVRLRWTPPGEAEQEIAVSTWMGGNQ